MGSETRSRNRDKELKNHAAADALADGMSDAILVLPPFHKGQVGLFALSIFMFIAHITIVIWPLWALMNSAVSSPALGAIFFFKGIFAQCAQYMPGQFQCDNFLRPVFSLSAYAIIQRSLAIISCIGMAASLILMLFGMESTKVFLKNPEFKVQIMKGAAVVMGTSAFMLLVCASLYASTLAKEFQGSEIYSAGLFGGKAKIDMDQIRFELGGCIYAAFCISAIEISCAVLIWMFRGFEGARQIDDKKAVDKDKEYEDKLQSLVNETRLNRKDYNALSMYN